MNTIEQERHENFVAKRASKRGPATNHEERRFDFSCRDRQGRPIGCTVYSYEVEYTEATYDPNNSWGYSYITPGHYYAARVQMTRAAEKYGPFQVETLFRTREEMENHIAKRVQDSSRRMRKQFTPSPMSR